MSRKVLSSGATGDTGRAAVRESLAPGLDVRAMAHGVDSRSETLQILGAELVTGDHHDVDTVRAAMEGVEPAYFVWPVKEGLMPAAVNFAQAAKEARVSIIINLSQRSANRHSKTWSCRDSFLTEEVFNWSGLSIIQLRPTYFLDWLLYPWQLPFVHQGILRLPAGKGRHSPIAADDQGRAVAELLKNPKDHIDRTIPLSGAVEMGDKQMAAELSEALGRKFTYLDLPIDEYCTSIPAMVFRPMSSSISGARWRTTRTATWRAVTTTSDG
jgi:NAD(P)H dehydrogenase (quinone)